MTPTSHDDHLYDDELHNEDVAHEHSDVNVRAVLTFAFGLAAIVIASAIAMRGLFVVFERMAAAQDPVVSPLAPPAGQLPPEPRLLINERKNLQEFRAQQAAGLEGIDAAKKRLLEQGLPVRAGAPGDAWMGTHSSASGESSGGRRIPLKAGSVPAEQAPPPAAAPAPAPAHAAPKSGGH